MHLSRLTGFYEQLKDRRVIRAALVYVALFWLLMQVADLLAEAEILSQVSVRWLILLSLVGFPIILVLSWFFEGSWHDRRWPAILGDVSIILAIAAWTMMSLGRVDDVTTYFSEAVRRNPAMTTGYTRLGRWYSGLGNDRVRGVACLREAIARDPENAFPKAELASIYVDLGLDDLAQQVLDKASDPHGAWDVILPFIRLKLHVYRNEQDQAREIAKQYFKQIGLGAQGEITMDVLIDGARQEGDFTQIVEYLELIIGPGDQPFDYTNIDVDSPLEYTAAFSLIRVHDLTGDTSRADAARAASTAFIQRQLLETPAMRPAFAHRLAQNILWQGEVDKALDVLEIIPSAYMRHAWYLSRVQGFQGLHGHPRFDAVVAAIESQMKADRNQLDVLGDNLPPCVTNMRANLK